MVWDDKIMLIDDLKREFPFLTREDALEIMGKLGRQEAIDVVSTLSEAKRYGLDIVSVLTLVFAWGISRGARCGRRNPK